MGHASELMEKEIPGYTQSVSPTDGAKGATVHDAFSPYPTKKKRKNPLKYMRR